MKFKSCSKLTDLEYIIWSKIIQTQKERNLRVHSHMCNLANNIWIYVNKYTWCISSEELKVHINIHVVSPRVYSGFFLYIWVMAGTPSWQLVWTQVYSEDRRNRSWLHDSGWAETFFSHTCLFLLSNLACPSQRLAFFFTVLDDEDLNHIGPGSSVGSLTSPGGAISEVDNQCIFLTRCPAHTDTLMSLLGFVADTCKHRERMIVGSCHGDREKSCRNPGSQQVQLGYKPLSRVNYSLGTLGRLRDTRVWAKREKIDYTKGHSLYARQQQVPLYQYPFPSVVSLAC